MTVSRRPWDHAFPLIVAWVLALPAIGVALSSPAVPNHALKNIPITVLSGFLGSGKTSVLQNMLENKQGLKIAVVVNDMASVNIDSKLVSRGSSEHGGGAVSFSDGMVELQNGCACCSLSDELLSSISNLVVLSDMKAEGDQFDHIVVELSGVADPKHVRGKFQEATMERMPLMERVQLDTLATLVDCSSFESHFNSPKMASLQEMPELYYRGGVRPKAEDEWKKDLPPKLLDAVLVGMDPSREPANDDIEGVADLLVSQTETADVVILNKVDLVEPGQVGRLQEIVGALNPRGKILTSTFGILPLAEVLGAAQASGVVASGAVDDHRDYVQAADQASLRTREASDTGVESVDTDHSHSHSHHDDGGDNAACKDPNCTDPSHDHSHDHSHTEGHAGISSFAYKARRPFHPSRLVSFLRNMPVVRGVPESSPAEEDDTAVVVPPETVETMSHCLRSKGFVWCADSHKSAMYWSHAGCSFELSCLGLWWAAFPREQWPQEEDVKADILRDFDLAEHDDVSNPIGVGDRRQEVVWIGPNLAEEGSQRRIREALDLCLLTDKEYDEYRSMQNDEKKLQARFANTMDSKYVIY